MKQELASALAGRLGVRLTIHKPFALTTRGASPHAPPSVTLEKNQRTAARQISNEDIQMETTTKFPWQVFPGLERLLPLPATIGSLECFLEARRPSLRNGRVPDHHKAHARYKELEDRISLLWDELSAKAHECVSFQEICDVGQSLNRWRAEIASACTSHLNFRDELSQRARTDALISKLQELEKRVRLTKRPNLGDAATRSGLQRSNRSSTVEGTTNHRAPNGADFADTARWTPPPGYVGVKEICNSERFRKSGKNPPRTTVAEWEKRDSDVSRVTARDTSEVYLPESWVIQKIAVWNPRKHRNPQP